MSIAKPTFAQRTLPAALVLLAACSPADEPGDAGRTDQADLVITNARIHTVNDAQPSAQAMVVADDAIVFVGSGADAMQYIGPDTRVEDLGGRFVMPGVVSTHEHSIFRMAVNSGLVFREVSHDKDVMLAEVREYLEANPDGPFMAYGGAYESTVEIHRTELDAVTGETPFFIMAATGHGGWANTGALEFAGVTATDEPIDFFGRDADGTPNGYVGTAAAAYYMMGVAGLSKEATKESAPEILRLIARNGVTHLHEVGQPPGHEGPLFDAIGELEREGALTARYTVYCMVQREQHLDGALEGIDEFNAKYNTEMFKVNGLKIHGDGSIEGHTAQLLEPYSDRPDERGILSVPEERSAETILEATRRGYDIHTHAIGDAANRSFLNVFEQVRSAGLTESRLSMGHTVLVDDADLDRFHELDVIANYYPLEAAQPNPQYLERLGPDRYNRLMRMGTMVDRGIRVSLSADYPSMPINPFLHMHAAITRSLVGDDETLGPESEKLTVAQAIRAYTLDAAHQVRAESYSGSLEPGKRADFIVLDRDLFEISPDEIVETQVLMTVVDGRVVFERED
jgi:predicted amidohydrolase YtcJ